MTHRAAILLRVVTVLGILLGSCGSVTAKDIESGNYWLPVCRESTGVRYIECLTFIQGFALGVQAQHEMGGKWVYCVEAGVSFGQFRLILLKYLSAHPEKLHMHISKLYVAAMREAFPC